ncbi:MAG: hypothetical protein Ct9H300mP21_06040 [Pseudomonadota bacterium]|nr:MAG: hypothetical protein Ct9H300mP21_06040 [Pseudomonadota bacterium]
MSFLRFDIPSSITDSHKIKFKISNRRRKHIKRGIAFLRVWSKRAGEKNRTIKKIGIIDHSLGATIATLTSLG